MNTHVRVKQLPPDQLCGRSGVSKLAYHIVREWYDNGRLVRTKILNVRATPQAASQFAKMARESGLGLAEWEGR